MTGGADADLVSRQLAHLDAARRLKRAIERHPDCSVGLARCLEVHVKCARLIAGALCGTTPAAEGLEIPAAGALMRR